MKRPVAGKPTVATLVLAAAVTLLSASVLDRVRSREELASRLGEVAARLPGTKAVGAGFSGAIPLGRSTTPASPWLASWQSVAGCGAGGGSASGPGGGIQWIGRNVTGGRIDAQVLTTQTFAQGNQFTSAATRLRTDLTQTMGLALNVPILYKRGEVSVLGTTRTASLSGFGDVSLELGYRFGAIRSHQLMLTASAPTGSANAVRQGVVLPQHLQLGSGVLGLTAQYQHTRDQDWGLVVTGGTLSYGGPQNDLGDFRAPSATAYTYLGYLWGPLVPSVGLTLFGKLQHDRERGAERSADRDPLAMLVPSVGLEWSSPWLAILPAATLGLSRNGVESLSFGLGISSSLF